MTDQEHLELLRRGSDVWNTWREQHPEVKPNLFRAHLSGAHLSGAHLSKANLHEADLRGADLRGADLSGAHLSKANLSKAHLSGAHLSFAHLSKANLSFAYLIGTNLIEASLIEADLSKTDLSKAYLNKANLSFAHLSKADLTEAELIEADLSKANISEAFLDSTNLSGANLSGANLSGASLTMSTLIRANLSGANLSGANLMRAEIREADLREVDLREADLKYSTLERTNLTGAILTQCSVYGISVWNVQLDKAKQENIVITDEDEPTITVDNLEVAQFIYLLLNNAKIRDVINTITTKVVLILGRFTPERKQVLDELRKALRQQNYLPVLFDFEKPTSRNFTETVSTLAHLARFIIADMTAPRSIPQELHAIIPLLRVPVQPLLHTSEEAYSMFEDLEDTYHWVLPTYRYTTLEVLLSSLKKNVIEPAERKAQELEKH